MAYEGLGIGVESFLKTPTEGGRAYVDYPALREAVKYHAGEARKVTGTALPKAVGRAMKKPGITPAAFVSGITPTMRTPAEQAMIQSAVSDWQAQLGAKEKEAGRAATALEITGAATERFLRGIDVTAETAAQGVAEAKGAWGQAVAKAGEYAEQAKRDIGEVLDRVTNLGREISEGREYAKAHAMQAAAQGVIGTTGDTLRHAAELYGVDSNEYRAAQGARMTTLATVQSQVETNYRQMAEETDRALLNANVQVADRMYMYKSFQEQQHVETMTAMAAAQAGYDLQLAEFNINVEQLRMSGLENLANWLVETPSFAMEITPVASVIAEVEAASMVRAGEAGQQKQHKEFMQRTFGAQKRTSPMEALWV